jgi:hypothetical protein
MPRGRRPSTAALTRLGARKASEMVILTCRTLHFSRVQSCATVVTRPKTTSSSHRRPRAIALTRRARRSNCSGRTLLRDALCGSRISRDLLEGGFCQGIVSDRSSGQSADGLPPRASRRTQTFRLEAIASKRAREQLTGPSLATSKIPCFRAQHPASEIRAIDVDGRLDAELAKVARKPFIRAFSSLVAKKK